MRTLNTLEITAVSGGTYCAPRKAPSCGGTPLSNFIYWGLSLFSCKPKPVCEPKPPCGGTTTPPVEEIPGDR
jgi:hypothetical protein